MTRKLPANAGRHAAPLPTGENVKRYSLDRVRAMLGDEFSYTIEGRPVSWQRTNVVRGRPMTDRKQREAKKVHAWTAAASMRSAAPSWALDGAFEVEVAAYYPDGVQGDADRLAGVPLDALEGIAYKADRQVKRLTVTVGVDRERPRTEVVVRRLHVDRGTYRELAYLHAALTARLGRGHAAGGLPGTALRQDWSLVPWPCESGCGVVWWDEADGMALARTTAPSHIGRVDVQLELGSAVRIHAPPQWLPGAYPVRMTTRSLVVVAANMRRGEREGQRVSRTTADARTIESALWTLARKLRVPMDYAPRVHVIADRTKPSAACIRGKPGRVEGWEGSVDLLASAPARWLLECASRGLGLGARGAYGCGAVTVEAMG